MKYVMFYEATGAREEGMKYFPGHRARLDQFHEAGTLLLVGAFTNPEAGAMGIFTSREAAEAFTKDDPFITSGFVKRWRIEEWNEIFAPEDERALG